MDNEPIRFEENQEVDVILSPRYYWAKKEILPVKYAYQAKKYAKSTFEDIIPEGTYNYLAKKDEDGFWLYAYDDSFILDEIEKLGVKSQQIRRVFFAQNELKNVEKPIKINRHEVLINHEDAIIKVPLRMTKESVEFSDYFKQHELSNYYVKLNKFSQMVDFKILYTIMFAILALIIFYGIEFYWLGDVKNDLQTKKDLISKKYKLPSTSLQRKALIRQLDKKMSSQQILREKIHHLFKLSLEPNNYIQSLKYNNQKFTITLHVQNQNQIQNIQNYLQTYFKMQNINKKNNLVTFEVYYD